VTTARRCSRTACRRPAVATLTYVYSDQTAVLGPLATYAEPHAYDLCDEHSERLSAPRGWEVVRLALDPDALGPSTDDLLALADAVREAAREPHPGAVATGTRVRAVPDGRGPDPLQQAAERARRPPERAGDRPGERRSHLRVLRPAEE
jgi:hypothetical protein